MQPDFAFVGVCRRILAFVGPRGSLALGARPAPATQDLESHTRVAGMIGLQGRHPGGNAKIRRHTPFVESASRAERNAL